MARSWNVQDEETDSGARTEVPRHGRAEFGTVFDVNFVKSVPGILFAVQIVCSFLGFVISVAWRGSYMYSGGHNFYVFMSFFTFITCLTLFVVRTVKLDDLLRRDIDWILIFTVYSGVAGLLILIASCIMLDVAMGESSLKAAAVFGLFSWTALLANFLINGHLLWQKKKGWLPQFRATVGRATVDVGNNGRQEDSERRQTNRQSNVNSVSAEDYNSDDFSEDDDEEGNDGVPVALTHNSLSPPSYHQATQKSSQSSLYPLDISGSNRPSPHRDSQSPHGDSGSTQLYMNVSHYR